MARSRHTEETKAEALAYAAIHGNEAAAKKYGTTAWSIWSWGVKAKGGVGANAKPPKEPKAPSEVVPPAPPLVTTRPVGRPTKLTPELQDEICAASRSGLGNKSTAALVGIDYATLKRWQAENDDFRASLVQARAEFEKESLDLIAAPTPDKGNPHQANRRTWLLERLYPERYARREKQDVTVRSKALPLDREAMIAEAEKLVAKARGRDVVPELPEKATDDGD